MDLGQEVQPDCQSESELEVPSLINHNPDFRFRLSLHINQIGIGKAPREVRALPYNLQDSVTKVQKVFLFCTLDSIQSVLLSTMVEESSVVDLPCNKSPIELNKVIDNDKE
jgi:hypothetical protein